MARRALVIGLGSNGYDVCNQLVRRIQWEYGGLERVPWLKVLCLETAEIPASSVLGQNGIHLTVSENDYSDLVSHPQDHAAALDLPNWMDADTMRIKSSITNGAGHIRMLGRLSFLFPDNYKKVRGEVKNRLDALKRLTPQDAKRLRGELPDGSDPDVDLSPKIWVYVVGTLLGGTCSGCFVDFGYFLQSQFEKDYNLVRTGIFALPHPAFDRVDWADRRANAYAALVELNHYSSKGVDYSVQYPLQPGDKTFISRQLPYRFCYLIQPRGATMEDYRNLQTTTAGYLRSEVFLREMKERDDARDNIDKETVNPDLKGAPQNYFTFGMSAIEYPASLIAQACCYKLGVEAFDEWLAPRPNFNNEVEAVRVNQLGVSTEKLQAALVRAEAMTNAVVSGAAQNSGLAEPDVRAQISDALKSAVSNARSSGKGALTELHEVEERLRQAFVASGPASDAALQGALPPGSIGGVVARNENSLAPHLKLTLALWVQQGLLDVRIGPNACIQLVEGLRSWLETRLRDISTPERTNEFNAAMDAANDGMELHRDKVAQCLNDPVLWFISGMGFGQREAVNKYLEEYEEAANEAFNQRLAGLLRPVEARVWSDLLRFVGQVSARLSNPEVGLVSQGHAVRELLATRLHELDDNMPVVNGTALFEPGVTVADTYDRFWTRAQGQQRIEAKARLLEAWDALPQRDRFTSKLRGVETFFDIPATPPTEEQRRAEAELATGDVASRARPIFKPVLTDGVLSRIITRSAAQNRGVIQEVLDKSQPLLQVGTNLTNIFVNAGTKRIKVAFFEGAASVVSPAQTPAHDFWDAVRAIPETNDLKPVDTDDRHSASFLQEFGAFSIQTIQGFREPHKDFAYDFDEQSKLRALHSRKDVMQWEPILGSHDPDDPKRKALFLLGLALYKPAGTVNSGMFHTGGTSPPGFGTQPLAATPPTPRAAAGVKLLQPSRTYRPDAAFVYELVPPLPPNLSSVEFPQNLKVVSTLLKNRPNVRQRMETDIVKIRQNSLPQVLVDAIMSLVLSIGALGLKEGDVPLTPMRAFELVTGYWAQDPDMTRVFEDIFRPDDMLLQQMWRSRTDGAPFDGFYCSNCGGFLSQNKDDVKGRCQHCNVYLRDVGLGL